jgi:endonuclease/exonuclease/phosphatase family metal-dependent hydrolase
LYDRKIELKGYNLVMRFWKWILYFLFVAICSLAVIVSYFGAGTHVVFDYVSLIPQYVYLFAWILVLSVGFFLASGWRQRIFVALMTTPLLVFSLLLFDVVWKYSYYSNNVVFTVFSWNTQRWDPSRQSAFFDIMKENESDFYLLQEVQYSENRWVYYDILQEFKEYQAAHFGEYIILSKFPLFCEPPSRLGSFLHCEASTPYGTIDLFNVHLKRPFHVTNFSTFEDYSVRRWQFDELMTAVHGQEIPLIIAGDFNSTRNYSFVRTLERTFLLNNPDGIFLMPHTFPTSNPQIRIDYQFTSDPFWFCGYKEIKRADLSDHVGIVGSLCIE